MADTRKYSPDQPLDAEQILQEARFRWLRPTEILEILSNFQLFKVTPQPPLKPPAGSLFLYDRKALRYFRKDGHRWRKKKDGKTVREAHEKLKFGSVDVLHCYYAHGEDNENFQRRCYWMLDEKLEHVVLVHYREINEGYKSGVSKLLVDPGVHVENIQPSFAPSFLQTAPVTSMSQAPCSSSPNMINWNAETLSLDFEDINSKSALGASTFTQSIDGLSDNSSLIASAVEGFPVLPRHFTGQCFVGVKSDYSTGSSLWPEICSSTTSLHGVHDQKFCVGKPSGTEFVTHKLTDAALNGDRSIPVTLVTANNFRNDSEKEHDFNLIPSQFHDHSGSQTAAPSTTKVQLAGKDGSANATGSGELKKLDSFGRWMDKEIDGDFDNSLMASDSGNYWNSIGAENDGKEVSSLSHHMHLDIESLGPSLSQEQLFNIIDFSPDWAYSGVETKVLIIGSFLGYKKIYSNSRWGCMFGEVEVPAEVLTDNVIRCQAPSCSTGRVPFYLTCCNRLACSEVREFGYCGYPSGIISSSVRSNQVEELQFQMRLAKLLCLDLGLSRLNCSADACEGCGLRRTLSSMRNDCKGDLESMPENSMVSVSNHMNCRDKLIQSLLKDRLCEWLVYKVHDGGKGPNVLDERGQGVIHLAAGLGYEWAMDPIVAASGNPNFRDAQGRTALHWASYFGREETVMALIRLDVDPTAVDDPTPASPGGHSAADLASSQGHKGNAGFLAEAFLNSHLSLLGYQPS